MRPVTPTTTRTPSRALTAGMVLALAGLALVGCSSTETDDAFDRLTPTSTSTPTSTDGEQPSTGPGGEDDRRGEPSSEVEVVMTPDEDVSEASAAEPIVEASTEAATGADEEDRAADAPQVDVGVSESAFCATLQIGHDAIADGDDDLADGQRDLLIERSPGLDDAELIAIIADLDAEQPLDGSVTGTGLERCQTLGFEL